MCSFAPQCCCRNVLDSRTQPLPSKRHFVSYSTLHQATTTPFTTPHHTTATPPPPHPLSHTSLIRLVVVCCRLRDQLAQAAARPVPKMSASSVESESNLDWGSRQSLAGVNSVVVEEVDSSLTQSVPTGGGIAMVRTSSNNLYAPTRHTVGTTSQRPRSFHEEGSFDPL